MPRQQGLSSASLGPTGPGAQGPSAAIQSIQDMARLNQQTTEKASKSLMQMQIQAQQEAQAQAAQMQSGVADVANQVAGGLARLQDEKNQREMLVEKTKTSEDMILFQQQLAENSQKEGQRIGLAMKQAEQATMTEIETWKAKSEQMRANHNGVVSSFNQMVDSGAFGDMPGGYQKMADIQKAIRMSEAYTEDHTDPAYMSQAVNLMQQAERDIQEGRDPMDLAALYDSPKSNPYAGIEPTGKRVDSIPGEERFSMMLREGYPETGIFGMEPDDPKLEHVDMVTPDTMARLLVDNAVMGSMVTKESRKKFVEQRMRSLHEADARFRQFSDQYKKINELMDSRAPESVRLGMESFLDNPDPGKFTNPGKTMFSQTLQAMFPEGGDQIVKMAEGVRNRTVDMDTAVEFGAAATLEAAAFSIEQRAIMSLTEIATEKGSSLARMANEYAMLVGPDKARQVWGSESIGDDGQLTGVGLVRAQRDMQAVFENLKSYAGEVRQAANEMGALQGFRKEFGTNSRLTDTYLYHYFTAQGEDKKKAKEMLFGEFNQAAGELGLEDLDRLSVKPTEDITNYRNILDSTLEMVQTLGPSQMPKLAALLSGGQVDLTDGNIEKFNAATASVADRSDYLQLTLDAMKDRKDITKEVGRMRAGGAQVTPEQILQMKQEKAKVREEKAASLQTFKQRGALGVVAQGALAAPGALVQGVEAVTGAGYAAGSFMGGQAYKDIIESLAERIAAGDAQRRESQNGQGN